MMAGSQFIGDFVTRDLRTTFVAFIAVLFCLTPHHPASGMLLPESFTKECLGTEDGLYDRFASQPHQRIAFYRAMYENCTTVTSNLEIVHLHADAGSELDLTFLENIRDVHGYVLVAANLVSRIPLTSLRLIRGLVLMPQSPFFSFNGPGFSLVVAANSLRQPDGSRIGLQVLELPSLREILRGSVLYRHNAELCYGGTNTIDWFVMLGRGVGRGVFSVMDPSNRPNCSSDNLCDAACTDNFDSTQRLCWGPGPNLCQKITSLTCHAECRGRCFGEGAGQCCHAECAGGCHGPGNRRCWACRNLDNDGSCVDHCPPPLIYDPDEHALVENPDVKYAYKTRCVDQCPMHMYVDHGACVVSCAEGRTPVNDICQDCEGPCPRICRGTTGITSDHMGFVHLGNIADFTNCTVIEGGLDIINMTFRGDPHVGIGPMTADELIALENVRVVRDYVSVNAQAPDFTSLGFLRNLREIKGQRLWRQSFSLVVYKTSLQSLDLDSLQSIENGIVALVQNAQLCHVENIPWHEILKSVDQSTIVRGNKDPDDCGVEAV